MRVSITLEQRYFQTPDKAVWTSCGHPYSFWTRYLSVFEEVNVVARVRSLADREEKWVRADGAGMVFSPVPYYIGPYQYAARWPWVRSAARAAIRPGDAVVMRVPSVLANCVEPLLRAQKRPYGLEVVGDPYDCLAPGAIRHPLRPLLRLWMPRALRRQCERADGVAYVTRRALQRRYPCRGFMIGVSDVTVPAVDIVDQPRVFSTHYSSISLDSHLLVPAAKLRSIQPRTLRIICVGMLEQFYKGHDVLLRAVAQCVAQDYNLSLVLAGDGRIRAELEKLARVLGIRQRCTFLGLLPAGTAVLGELDNADLFVLPSRTEGLPRAMVEAMARGLPCIGTSVGGIPELLAAEDMVPPDDPTALAALIREVADSPQRRLRMSLRNIATAREYTEDVLQKRRIELYRHIAKVTASANRAPVRPQLLPVAR